MITICFLFYITKLKTIMNSNSKTTEKQNHYLNMLKFYKQKYSTKQKFNANTNSNSNLNIDKRGTKRKFSEAFL